MGKLSVSSPQGTLQQLIFVMGDPAAASEHCYSTACTPGLSRLPSPGDLSPAWTEVWLPNSGGAGPGSCLE